MNAGQHPWEIGLSSWIIQDGNYPEFTTGQQAEFALEFFPTRVCGISESMMKSARCLGAARYEIIGAVVYLSPEVWVLDFGICAFQEAAPPEGMSVGNSVTAEIQRHG